MATPRSLSSHGHSGSSPSSSCLERGIQSDEQGFSNLEKAQNWPTDALKAIETHLNLLGKVARRNREFLDIKSSFDGREDQSCCNRNNLVAEVPVQDSSSRFEDIQSKDGPLVELNSESPLPRGWEQFLDLRTGQVYFIDWNVCKRSRFDPRKFVEMANSEASMLQMQSHACWELQSQITELGISDCASQGRIPVSRMVDAEEMEMEVESKYTCITQPDGLAVLRQRGSPLPSRDNHSEISSEETFESSDSSSWSCEKSETGMVVKGCQKCLSYILQSKQNPLCPNCGSALI